MSAGLGFSTPHREDADTRLQPKLHVFETLRHSLQLTQLELQFGPNIFAGTRLGFERLDLGPELLLLTDQALKLLLTALQTPVQILRHRLTASARVGAPCG